MKIRVWCKKHQVPLRNFEESTLIFTRANVVTGEMEVDLSDYMCPVENMDLDEEGVPKDDCTWSWIVELLHYSAYVAQDPYTQGEYEIPSSDVASSTTSPTPDPQEH